MEGLNPLETIMHQDDVDTAKHISKTLFEQNVYPILKTKLGYIECYDVEATTIPLLQKLDHEAGVDFVLEKFDGGLHTLANRCQYDGRCWRTFTIRKSVRSRLPTEWYKRIRDVAHDNLRPKLTCQSYHKHGKLIGLAVCETDKLFKTALELKEKKQLESRMVSNASFYYLYWDQVPLVLEV